MSASYSHPNRFLRARRVRSAQSAAGPWSPAAFTLVELVIVMVILAAVGAMAMPRMQNSIQRTRIESAAARVTNDLEHSRSLARTRGAAQRVVFSVVGSTSSYTLLDAESLRLSGDPFTVELSGDPYQVSIDTVDFGGDATIVFNGYGLPDTGGEVQLSSGSYQATLVVEHPSGRIYRK